MIIVVLKKKAEKSFHFVEHIFIFPVLRNTLHAQSPMINCNSMEASILLKELCYFIVFTHFLMPHVTISEKHISNIESNIFFYLFMIFK